jgi:hypothetical protein
VSEIERGFHMSERDKKEYFLPKEELMFASSLHTNFDDIAALYFLTLCFERNAPSSRPILNVLALRAGYF